MRTTWIVSSIAATALLAACSSKPAPSALQAKAALAPIAGSGVTGHAVFTEQANGHVLVNARVEGLKANATHGFHIHEHGSCQDNGNAAGGHFNPIGSAHGKYNTPHHHLGDLPSLKADANGIAIVNALIPSLAVTSGANSIESKALIVHADPDDYTSQPNGNAGARIACAVIAK